MLIIGKDMEIPVLSIDMEIQFLFLRHGNPGPG
jgi:hypothetical protein